MSSDWERFRQAQERLQREAEERARQQEQQQQLGERQRFGNEAIARSRAEQLRNDALAAGQESVRQLEQEARTVYHLYDIGESIKQDWERQGASVQVTNTQSAAVALNDDGTLQSNRSWVGIKIAYSYDDVETKTSEVVTGTGEEASVHYETSPERGKETNKIVFGLGYYDRMNGGYYGWGRLSDWSTIEMDFSFLNTPPPASDELRKGVKSFWVSGSENDVIYGKAIPVNFPGSQNAFYNHLNERVTDRSPEKFLPAAARRLREHGHSEPQTRPQTPATPQKPKFFRRLFKRG